MHLTSWQLPVGLCLIAAAVVLIRRRIDVRLVLFLTAIALGALAGQTQAIFIKFYETFTDEKFVIPICTAMGFAYVLKHTGCDQHLIHLLVKPLRAVRFLLIPGTVVVGFLVNMPIVSQTSTAVTIGTVLIPVLIAARIPKLTIAAAILLGSSVGGELYNPGAPEFITTITGSKDAASKLAAERASGQHEQLKDVRLDPAMYTPEHCVSHLVWLNLLSLFVAASVFWLLNRRLETRTGESSSGEPGINSSAAVEGMDSFQVSYAKAFVPLVPIVLLYLTSPMFALVEVPKWWFVDPAKTGSADTRMIGAAMLVGCAVAAAISWRTSLGVADAFFQGAGYGFANIISLIVIANCFGEGLKHIGLAQVLGQSIGDRPGLLMPLAGYLSLGFAALCGSGMATAQSLFGFFAEPALLQNIDPAHVGAVVSLASAAGRTMSPVAAVALMTAKMTDVPVFTLVRQVVLPLMLSTTAVIAAAMAFVPAP
jgi:DcuC family C4-dicarboxylate transporter